MKQKKAILHGINIIKTMVKTKAKSMMTLTLTVVVVVAALANKY